jgi:hypothetical protein
LQEIKSLPSKVKNLNEEKGGVPFSEFFTAFKEKELVLMGPLPKIDPAHPTSLSEMFIVDKPKLPEYRYLFSNQEALEETLKILYLTQILPKGKEKLLHIFESLINSFFGISCANIMEDESLPLNKEDATSLTSLSSYYSTVHLDSLKVSQPLVSVAKPEVVQSSKEMKIDVETDHESLEFIFIPYKSPGDLIFFGSQSFYPFIRFLYTTYERIHFAKIRIREKV